MRSCFLDVATDHRKVSLPEYTVNVEEWPVIFERSVTLEAPYFQLLVELALFVSSRLWILVAQLRPTPGARGADIGERDVLGVQHLCQRLDDRLAALEPNDVALSEALEAHTGLAARHGG